MRILPVHLVYHLLRTRELRVEKLHRVPVVVAAPVLPVLDYAVERNTQFPVLVHYLKQFILGLVAFPALMEAVGPEREHRNLSGQFPHPGYHPVGIPAVDEIIVYAVADLRFKGEIAFRTCLGSHQTGRRIIVPEYAVALDGLVEMGEVLEIALLHAPVFAAETHLAVLEHSDSVYAFVSLD